MNKPSISEVSRKNNSARVSKFASSIIPPAPEVDTPAADPVSAGPDLTTELRASQPEAVQPAQAGPLEGKQNNPVVDERRPAAVPETPLASRGVPRKRTATNSLAMEEILGNKAPEEETFPKMTRIAEKHHELLRKIAYEQRKPMNTILYNLLEVLDQTYQRNQQSDV